MNCPFCGTTLAKVAAICPSCKTQLPEARLFNYYAAALERDKSLAQPEKRKKLDSLVQEESAEREKLLVEAIRNPEEFQSILDIYNKKYRGKILQNMKPSETEALGLQKLFGTLGASQQGKR